MDLAPFAVDGVITRRAAAAAGISDAVLRDQLRRGAIARVARGAYVADDTHVPRADPRVITASWRVVLSHLSAAAWWGIDLPAPVGALHVTAPATADIGVRR